VLARAQGAASSHASTRACNDPLTALPHRKNNAVDIRSRQR
jgi:hypothetical protein